MLLYPFQLFGFFSQHDYTHKVSSICSTRCELILCLFLSVNCSTVNPFVHTLNRLMSMYILSLIHSNTRSTDIQVVEEEACHFSFDILYELIIRDLEEPLVNMIDRLIDIDVLCFIIYFIKYPLSSSLLLPNPSILSFPKYSVFLSSLFYIGLLHMSDSLSDQQLYLCLTLLLSFSQNVSFTSYLFSTSAQTTEYSFFMERIEKDSWCVGHLLEVLLIQILYQHIHQPAVRKMNEFECIGLLRTVYGNGSVM